MDPNTTVKEITVKLFTAVNLAATPEEVFASIHKELSVLMNTQNLYLGLLSEDKERITTYYIHDINILSEVSLLEKSLNSYLIQQNTSLCLTQKEILELESNNIIKPNSSPAKVWIGTLLKIGNEVIGILALPGFETESSITNDQLPVLEEISSYISFAIHRLQSVQALRVSEQHLRESNISKDKFFSIIAHDLRGPFNAIIGFSDLLYNDYDQMEEAEKMTMIRNIHDASIGTFKLLENLLEWSRIQTGRTIPNPENIDLSTIANTSLGVLKPLAEKKNIKLFSGIHFGTIAFCDETMITTAIRNLISNSIKFTSPGGNVRIWGTTKENHVEITVADNGVGIPKANLEKLFRLDESVKTRGTAGEQGTGLGLILCREFIELNGGSIWAESEPGMGSQFKFTLPKQIP